MRFSLILLAVLLSGCVTNLQVTGPHARSLSPRDIAALRQLTESGHYHSITITAIGPNRVTMWTARTIGNENRYGDLEAVRSNGIWRLVKRPDLPPSQKPLLLY
jgi:hypothetical protein